MVFTKAKMWAAVIGGSCTAIATAATTIQLILGDGKVGTGEITTLVITATTLISTVYGVWKTRNEVVTPNGGQ